MQRALTKPHIRVIAVDDGAFSRRQRYAPLVAVILSAPKEVEGVLLVRVRVDGDDATETILGMLRGSAFTPGARALIVDGIAVGGFNLVDLGRLSRALRLPVVSVTRRRPDFAKIRAALAKYFPRQFRRRWARVRAHRLFPVPTGGEPIYASAVGCREVDAVALLRRLAVRGYWPEPLRLAHMIAHACGAAAARLARR